MNNKKYLVKVFVLVVSLMVLAFSATFAYFTMTINGNTTTTTATSGTYKISTSLENANAINNTKMLLINEEEKEERAEELDFTVTSSSDTNVDGEFYLYIQDIVLSKNFYSEYLKWEILKEDEIVSHGDFSNAVRTDTPVEGEDEKALTQIESFKLNEKGINIPKNVTTNYTFRMYLLNDKENNQISLTEGHFEGKLFMEAVPISQLNS